MSFEIPRVLDALQEDTILYSAPESPEVTDRLLDLDDTIDPLPRSYLDDTDSWNRAVNKEHTNLAKTERRRRIKFLRFIMENVEYDPPSSVVQPVVDPHVYGPEDFRAEIKAMRTWDNVESYKFQDGTELTGDTMYWTDPQPIPIICDETPPEITEMIIRVVQANVRIS